MLTVYEKYVRKTLERPREALLLFAECSCSALPSHPASSAFHFSPRSDAGQFVINVKAPTGTRIEVTNNYIKQVEDIVHQVVRPERLEHGRLKYRRYGRSCPLCSRQIPACTRHSCKWA